MKISDLSGDERYLLYFFRGASPELKEILSSAFDALREKNIKLSDFPKFTLIRGGK